MNKINQTINKLKLMLLLSLVNKYNSNKSNVDINNRNLCPSVKIRENLCYKEWYHLDHLNSTKATTDEAGKMSTMYEYRAFGEELKKLGSGDAKYKFQGKELDEETNLMYFNARYYDQTIGRFINVDPIQSGENWYVAFGNNPLNKVDPTGLEEKDINKTISNIVNTVVFQIERAMYIIKYHDKNYINETKDNAVSYPLKESDISKHGAAKKYNDGSIHSSDKTAVMQVDLWSKEGNPLYTTSEQNFKLNAQRWENPNNDRQGYGFYTESTSKDGVFTFRYAHNNPDSQVSKDFNNLSKSAQKAGLEDFTLPKGTQIAEIGNTGRSTNAHSHYEVRDNKSKKDYYGE